MSAGLHGNGGGEAGGGEAEGGEAEGGEADPKRCELASVV